MNVFTSRVNICESQKIVTVPEDIIVYNKVPYVPECYKFHFKNFNQVIILSLSNKTENIFFQDIIVSVKYWHVSFVSVT